jgi:hydroxymethylpyrimidine pyrophosphatase-like HAD family hydrolase
MNIKITENKEKHLIIVDLDGTLLNKDFSTLNQKNKKVLQELQKRGHEICIATGRNYLSALPFYKEIGLDTFLITYNGAYINHPLKNETPSITIPISNQVIRGILAEDIIKENLLNVMIDSTDKQSISTSNDVYYQEIFFNNNPYVVIDTVASVPVSVNPHSFQINTKKNGVLYYDINKHKQGEAEIQKLKENIDAKRINEYAFFIESKSKEG